MKPAGEYQSVDELRVYFKARVMKFLDEMEEEENGFEIENKVYAIAIIATHVYKKMREANNISVEVR